MTLLIGSEGSMGKRYQSILNEISEPFQKFDVRLTAPVTMFSSFSRFIIASPTDTHLDWIRRLDHYGKPILCEKPLSKSGDEIEEILRCKSPLTMTMQYLWLWDADSFGESSYDFYHHGNDGLVWDCFQIIALAKSKITLAEKSPIWKCKINGKPIARQNMDWAYVQFVRAWLNGKVQTSRAELRDWHQKVKEFEETWITPQ